MEYERRNPINMIFEYMVPSSCWTENTDSYCLLIDLPGFKKEQLRIGADNYGHVIVSGERQSSDNKIIHFEQSFKVPENCNIEETSAILDDQIYCVTIPKKLIPEKEAPQAQKNFVQEKDEIQNNANNDNDDDYNETIEEEEEEKEGGGGGSRTRSADEWSENSLLEKISMKMKRNRSIVLIAFLAFSLGVLVSHRHQQTAQVERSK